MLSGSACLAVVVLVACHELWRVKYPVDRTAIYFVPLVSLGIAMGAVEFGKSFRRIGWAVFAVCVLVVARYAVELNASYYRIWKYDADSREVFRQIEMTAKNRGRTLHVGGSWFYEPAINYYRMAGDAGVMLPYSRKLLPELASYDLLLLSGADAARLLVDVKGFMPVYRGRLSDVVVYANSSALGVQHSGLNTAPR